MTLNFPDEERVREIVREEVHEEVKTQLTSFRSDVMNGIDGVMSELKAMREDQIVHNQQYIDINDKLEEHDQQLTIINKKLNLSY